MSPRRQPAKVSFTAETGVTFPRALRTRAPRLLAQAARAAAREFGSVGIAFVSPTTVRQLNRTYRRHDRVTDVLSFTYQEQPVAGELVICLEQAERQAKRRGHPLMRELEVLVTHGFLHLAGHDHVKLAERKVMRALEKRVLKSVA